MSKQQKIFAKIAQEVMVQSITPIDICEALVALNGARQFGTFSFRVDNAVSECDKQSINLRYECKNHRKGEDYPVVEMEIDNPNVILKSWVPSYSPSRRKENEKNAVIENFSLDQKNEICDYIIAWAVKVAPSLCSGAGDLVMKKSKRQKLAVNY